MTRISSAVIACVLFFGTLHVAAHHVLARQAIALREIQVGMRGPLSLNEAIRVELATFVEKYVLLLELAWVIVVLAWVFVRIVRRTPTSASADTPSRGSGPRGGSGAQGVATRSEPSR